MTAVSIFLQLEIDQPILCLRILDVPTNTPEQNETVENAAIGKKTLYELFVFRFSPRFGIQNE